MSVTTDVKGKAPKDNEEGGPTGGGITNVISANVKNRSMIVRCK